MSDIPEHLGEPEPGLPERLPAGERILWQGKPNWIQFAIHTMHARAVAVYFAALLVWRLFSQGAEGNHGLYVVLATIGLGLLSLLAWLMARAALYTITDRRVVMRFGIAIPISINLPYNSVESVEFRKSGGTSGDIVIDATADPAHRLSYMVSWPHVRPWRIANVQPMMRSVDNAEQVAGLLAEALHAHVQTSSEQGQSVRPAAPSLQPEPARSASSFPLPPLIGAGALLTFALVSVAWLQLSGNTPTVAPIENVVASVQLQFEDRSDGAVLVYNAETGEFIEELPAGSNNFLRATLRGLVRGRNAMKTPDRPPFGLYQIADGRLLLSDPTTGRQVDLWAFGKTNAAAFAAFLPDGAPVLRISSVDRLDMNQATAEITVTNESGEQ